MKRLIVLFALILAALPVYSDTGAILVFGDSLSAGLGLSSPDQGWVALLQHKLQSEGYDYRVINASVSGETTAGGLARLPRALSLHHPRIVILELGGNDGLRALPVDAMRGNLEQMAQAAGAAGAEVLLLGLRIPPNYGLTYSEQFYSAYGQVAGKLHLRLVHFFLQDVALDAALMQADGIHPNERGQPRLLQNAWEALRPMLKK
jgi:acyl-CoA thioesterase I